MENISGKTSSVNIKILIGSLLLAVLVLTAVFAPQLTKTGPNEADPMNNRISFLSPIGAAIHKRRQGETVTVATPGGKIKMKIVHVK